MIDEAEFGQVQQHDITPAGSNTIFPVKVNWTMVSAALLKNPTNTPLQIDITDSQAISLADQIFPAASLVDILAKKARRDETLVPERKNHKFLVYKHQIGRYIKVISCYKRNNTETSKKLLFWNI